MAAGPLEELLAEHWDDVIEQVETFAQGGGPIRRALSSVYLTGDRAARLRSWMECTNDPTASHRFCRAGRHCGIAGHDLANTAEIAFPLHARRLFVLGHPKTARSQRITGPTG